MDAIQEMLSHKIAQLIGRASGPLNFRLVIMPTVVTILAIRAGLRDARQGEPAFLWSILTKPTLRRRLLRSALKDIGRIIIMALVLDTTYQLMVLRGFYLGQALIVAVACAIVPYILIRGPVTRLTRGLYRKQTAPANGSGDKNRPDAECQPPGR